jgi:Tol biopolymer transport system component
VERCLEKDPERRYAATRDLARDLSNLRDRSSEAAGVTLPAPRRRVRRIVWAAAAALTLALAIFAARPLRNNAPGPPAFQRLTFGRGVVTSARFTPDGQNVVYSARWGGQAERLFIERIGNAESLPLPFPEATQLLGVSRAGNLALALQAEPRSNSGFAALLGIAPLVGGTAREVRKSVQSADFFPGSDRLAIVVHGHLESPPGTVLYNDGTVGRARVSPRGDRIAILEFRDDAFFVSVVDLSGKRTLLAEIPTVARVEEISGSQHGLAWSSDGEEIIYSSGTVGAANSLLAVSTRGKVRTVLRVPGYLSVQDVAPDGRILLTSGDVRSEVLFRSADGGPERDLAWLSMAFATQFSADGTAVLMWEPGVTGGAGLYLRKTDGSPAFRLPDQRADTLSPDGAWIARTEDGKALLTPTGTGETRRLSQPGFTYQRVLWFPDGRRILVIGSEEGHGHRLYVQDASGGAMTPLSTEGISHDTPVISPDGAFVAVAQPDGYWVYPVSGEPPWSFHAVEDGEIFASWSEDSRAVLTTFPDRAPFRVYRVDVRSGQRELWKVIAPSDPSGVCNAGILLRPDGSSVMNATRYVNDLFLVEPAH